MLTQKIDTAITFVDHLEKTTIQPQAIDHPEHSSGLPPLEFLLHKLDGLFIATGVSRTIVCPFIK